MRLLHPGSVSPAEAAAAMNGLRRFERFGLALEEGVLDPKDMKNVCEVKYGEKLHRLSSEDLIVADNFTFLIESLSIFFHEKQVYGLFLMPARIQLLDDGDSSFRMGLARSDGSAMVSLSPIRSALKGEEAARAIAVFSAHEAGHVLGKSNHCTKDDCIMKPNDGGEKTFQHFLGQVKEICSDCMSVIGRHISKSRY